MVTAISVILVVAILTGFSALCDYVITGGKVTRTVLARLAGITGIGLGKKHLAQLDAELDQVKAALRSLEDAATVPDRLRKKRLHLASELKAWAGALTEALAALRAAENRMKDLEGLFAGIKAHGFSVETIREYNLKHGNYKRIIERHQKSVSRCAGQVMDLRCDLMEALADKSRNPSPVLEVEKAASALTTAKEALSAK